MGRYFKYFFRILLVAIVVLIIYPKLKDSIHEIPSLLVQSNKYLLIAILFFQIIKYIFDGWLSQILLKIVNHTIKLWDTFRIAVLSIIGSQFFPLVGMAFATYYFYKKIKVSTSAIFFLIATWTFFIYATNMLIFMIDVLFFRLSAISGTLQRLISLLIFFLITLTTILYFLFLKNTEKLAAFIKFITDRVNRIVRLLFKKPQLIDPTKPAYFIKSFHNNLQIFKDNKLKILEALLAAILFYIADVATLYFSFLVFGYSPDLSLLIFGFTLALAFAFLTFIPESPGVMEASFAGAFIALGFPAHIALLASILFRIFSFWLPLPFAIVFYFNVRQENNNLSSK